MNDGSAAKLIAVLEDIANSLARAAVAAEDTARFSKAAMEKLDRMAAGNPPPADLDFTAPPEVPSVAQLDQAASQEEDRAISNLESVLAINRALSSGLVRVGASGLVELSQ